MYFPFKTISFDKNSLFYLIDDGRIWSTTTNTWVEKIDCMELIKAHDEQGNNTLQGLVETLKFYDLPYPMNFAELKASKLAEVKTKADAINAHLKTKYAKFEVDSFPEQQEEAQKVLAGETLADNALLMQLVAGENAVLPESQKISLNDFAVRVINNVAQAKAATLGILYQLRSFETAVKLANSLEELDNINIEYNLGG